jgi:hypothetical protein
MKHSLLVAVAFSLTVSLVPLSACAITYHLVDLGSHTQAEDINRRGQVAGVSSQRAAWFMQGAWRVKKGNAGSIAMSIDNAGDMVGYTRVVDRGNESYPLVYYPRGAAQLTIPLPDGAEPAGNVDAPYPFVARISPDGTQVAGNYRSLPNARRRCLVWHPGEMTSIDLDPPAPYDSCWVFDVNDAGEVLGWVGASSRPSSAFIFKNGTFSLIGQHQVFLPRLERINKKGHAAGSNGNEAVYWDGKHVRTLPGGTFIMREATAINDHDEIVGIGDDHVHRTLLKFSGGAMVDLVPLIDNIGAEWNFTGYEGLPAQPTGINERGEIAGYAWYDDDVVFERHGYILVPN